MNDQYRIHAHAEPPRVHIAAHIASRHDLTRMEANVRHFIQRDGLPPEMFEFIPTERMYTPFGRLTGMEVARVPKTEHRYLSDHVRNVATDAICEAAIIERDAVTSSESSSAPTSGGEPPRDTGDNEG